MGIGNRAFRTVGLSEGGGSAENEKEAMGTLGRAGCGCRVKAIGERKQRRPALAKHAEESIIVLERLKE